MGCRITDFLRPEWIILSLNSTTKYDVLAEISRHMCHVLPANARTFDAEGLAQRLRDREDKASTGADHGLAIPHTTVPGDGNMVVSIARSQAGVSFGALDNHPSHIFFTIINPSEPRPGEATYLQAIATICRLMRTGHLRTKLMAAKSVSEIYAHLLEEESLRIQA